MIVGDTVKVTGKVVAIAEGTSRTGKMLTLDLDSGHYIQVDVPAILCQRTTAGRELADRRALDALASVRDSTGLRKACALVTLVRMLR